MTVGDGLLSDDLLSEALFVIFLPYDVPYSENNLTLMLQLPCAKVFILAYKAGSNLVVFSFLSMFTSKVIVVLHFF